MAYPFIPDFKWLYEFYIGISFISLVSSDCIYFPLVYPLFSWFHVIGCIFYWPIVFILSEYKYFPFTYPSNPWFLVNYLYFPDFKWFYVISMAYPFIPDYKWLYVFSIGLFLSNILSLYPWFQVIVCLCVWMGFYR